MSEAKHTPGPWDIDTRSDGLIVGCAVHGRTGIHSIAAMAIRDGLMIDTAKANAKLIAAAPELLEACQLLLMCSLPVDVSGQRMVETARAAIRKATT